MFLSRLGAGGVFALVYTPAKQILALLLSIRHFLQAAGVTNALLSPWDVWRLLLAALMSIRAALAES